MSPCGFAPCRVRLALCAVMAFNASAARPQWIKARLGSFEAISDDGRRSATQALSQFEQFSFALGTAMGQPDLRLDPPLRIIVFKNAQEMRAQCPPGLMMGRDRLMACTTSEGQLPQSLLRDLTRTLLESNFSRMPTPIEKALETFFSTVESNAVHVTWGAAPPQAERTREWALLHRIITQPDYSGKAKIYLHNLAAGMDTECREPQRFRRRRRRSSKPKSIDTTRPAFSTRPPRPIAPLNPDRDFNTTFLTSDEGELMRADLADARIRRALRVAAAGRETRRRRQRRSGRSRHAEQRHREGARLHGSRAEGRYHELRGASPRTRNWKDDPDQAIEILKQALTLDPKYAEAHWIFGEKLSDPARRMAEWKQAVNLAPAQLRMVGAICATLRGSETICRSRTRLGSGGAGGARRSAAGAIPDRARADRTAAPRSGRSGEAQRRRGERAGDRPPENGTRAKNLPISRPAPTRVRFPQQELAKTVEWFDDAGSAKITGVLMRVDCIGKQLRLNVKDDEGKTQSSRWCPIPRSSRSRAEKRWPAARRKRGA